MVAFSLGSVMRAAAADADPTLILKVIDLLGWATPGMFNIEWVALGDGRWCFWVDFLYFARVARYRHTDAAEEACGLRDGYYWFWRDIPLRFDDTSFVGEDVWFTFFDPAPLNAGWYHPDDRERLRALLTNKPEDDEKRTYIETYRGIAEAMRKR